MRPPPPHTHTPTHPPTQPPPPPNPNPNQSPSASTGRTPHKLHIQAAGHRHSAGYILTETSPTHTASAHACRARHTEAPSGWCSPIAPAPARSPLTSRTCIQAPRGAKGGGDSDTASHVFHARTQPATTRPTHQLDADSSRKQLHRHCNKQSPGPRAKLGGGGFQGTMTASGPTHTHTHTLLASSAAVLPPRAADVPPSLASPRRVSLSLPGHPPCRAQQGEEQRHR